MAPPRRKTPSASDRLARNHAVRHRTPHSTPPEHTHESARPHAGPGCVNISGVEISVTVLARPQSHVHVHPLINGVVHGVGEGGVW
ncbi:unnamed protein product, partial [Mesocestoides corti]|uniref:Uncharacterized protein n=1 Tax=Mesocestoides corti TaxID=53468 RepID=A0A0R3UR65_MESCO